MKIISAFAVAFLILAPLQTIHADGDSSDASSTPSSDVASTTPDTSSDDSIGTTTPLDLGSTTPDETATSTSATSTPTTGTATLTVRDGSVVAFSGTVTFPLDSSTLNVTPTNSSSTVAIANDSVLGVLLNLEPTESAFNVTDLEYFSDFDEFLINCIDVPAANSIADCGSWQYQVDGTNPPEGADQYLLQNGDNVFVYFGNPRQVALATSTVSVGESFVATAQSYDPSTNTYVSASGYVIGITQPNPADPFSPIEIATSTADADGNATFVINTPGAYGAGLQSDGYFPLTPLTVVATSTATTAPSSGGSSGGGSSSDTSSGTTSAFSYLVSQQSSDGSILNPVVTDWSALALALSDAPQTARQKLKTYLITNQESLSATTDYERHAIALMALGINPYTGSGTDDITPIVQAFNGTYIGDPSLPADDMFGLIALMHAGYSSSDLIIQKSAAYLVGTQKADGSWSEGGETADLAGAGIQALVPLQSLPGVSSAIAKAESYLHNQQQEDSGWGNGDSTSWALGGIAALGQTPSNWSMGVNTPLTSLESNQQPDGGFDPVSDPVPTRTWSTAYALTALEGRSWSSLLSNFSKPAGLSAAVTGTTATSTLATTTPVTIATTTATTTVPLLTPLPIIPPVLPPPVVPLATALHPYNAPKIQAPESSTTLVTSDNLAAVDASPVVHTFWDTLAGVFASIGTFFRHLF